MANSRVLIALTNDPALSRAIQELVAAGVEVGIVQSPQALSDELLQHSSAIALIDSASVDTPIDALVDQIAAQFPDLRLLVAGHGTEQTLLATRIAKQTVFRFVHKPASAQRLKLFLDAVGRQNDTPRPVVVAPKPVAKTASPFGGPGISLGGGSTVRMAAIGGSILLAVVLGAWLLWPKGSDPASGKPVSAAASPQAGSGPAHDLVVRADQAFAAGRYVATDGTSSAELYRDALKLDEKDAVARAGFDRSIEYGLRSAEEALLASRLDAAASVAETLRLLVPGNSRLSFLQTQIDRETARVNADASQRQALESRQVKISESLELMNEAISRRALVDPARNSAVLHFRAAAAVNAADPAVRNARETLVAALLTAADNELAAQHLAPATRYIDTAASINSGASGLDVLRRRAREMQTQTDAATVPVPAAVTATTPEAPPAASPAPAPAQNTPAAPVVVAESTLRRISKVDPIYPPRALEKLVSGWVRLQFTVAADGSVQDVQVMDAEPKNTFDRSAVAALRKWRYAPTPANSTAPLQRAEIRMRFTASDPSR